MQAILIFALIAVVSGALAWCILVLVARMDSRKLLLFAAWITPILVGVAAVNVGIQVAAENVVIEPANEAKDAGPLVGAAVMLFAVLSGYAALVGSAIGSFMTCRRLLRK